MNSSNAVFAGDGIVFSQQSIIRLILFSFICMCSYFRHMHSVKTRSMSAGDVFREPSVSYTRWTVRSSCRFRTFNRFWRDGSSPCMRSFSPLSINTPKLCLLSSLIIFAWSVFSATAVHCKSHYDRNSSFLDGLCDGQLLHGKTVGVSFSSRIDTATLLCSENTRVRHFSQFSFLYLLEGRVTQER